MIIKRMINFKHFDERVHEVGNDFVDEIIDNDLRIVRRILLLRIRIKLF